MKPKSYPLSDYPKVGSIAFPKELPIAYAVCGTKCGNRAFIVDGGTQVCEYCGRVMFRTEVKSYVLKATRKEKRQASSRTAARHAALKK